MKERILAAACRHLDVDVNDVLSWRVYDDRVVMIVNRGIAGCPKYEVPLAQIETPTRGKVSHEGIKVLLETGRLPVDATSSARRLAEEKGIDLTGIEGSGKDGRITIGDVRSALC